VLAHLTREGATAQCDLAMALGQHPAWVSRLVDELEAEGVVRRRRDAHDRRKLRVEVTVSGRARYEARRPEVNEAVEHVLEPLDPAEREELRALLLKLAP
jgi:DNA-binding MarR family transcriptional regulator